jgi:hypothetical protein
VCIIFDFLGGWDYCVLGVVCYRLVIRCPWGDLLLCNYSVLEEQPQRTHEGFGSVKQNTAQLTS